MGIRKKRIKCAFVVSVLISLCLFMASVLSFYLPTKTADAILSDNIETDSTNLGEMLLDGYENDTTGKGKVFDGAVFWELVSQISGEKNPDKSTLDNLTMPKTSADFRTNNNKLDNGIKDIVVQIGGKKWIATYLSTNSKGEPILTLWLANSTTLGRFNSATNYNLGTYPSNMYGTSEIRAKTLNNGGVYAANNASLTSVAQDINSEWAIYTMDKKDEDGNTVLKGSIKEFIEVPDNMDWQHNQVAIGNVTSSEYTFNYNNNNDALDFGGNGSVGDYTTNARIDIAGYKGWANDTLWIPSVAETGVNEVEGIWKSEDSTRANSANSWLRSAYYAYYGPVYLLDKSGASLSDSDVSFASYAVRPAFHLNLIKVASSTGLPIPVAGDKIKYYDNGNTAQFELSRIKSMTDIIIEATDMEGNALSSPSYSVNNSVLSFNANQV
ncbi:MAG: hypothetical protein K2H36_00965, partial [Clostridia bacterium]|nr:hypothetical protein [Clostridia bacterium]